MILKIKYPLALLLVLLFHKHLSAHSVNVRILTTKVITSFIFSPSSGNYSVMGDGKLVDTGDESAIYQLVLDKDSILLKTFEKNLGKFKTIRFYSNTIEPCFKIKSVVPDGKTRTYEGALEVTLWSDKKQLLLINRVELESYIAGVVESESGTKTTPEYYKLQAILCRTYLLSHLNRHATEGFEVCDDVHCQAYLSRSKDIEIIKAVYETQGLVVVDNDLNLITAAFHSNCGGQTVNSQDVWSVATPYLKSIKDTFCLNAPHAKWKREISIEDWKAYLQLKHKYPVNDSLKFNNATTFAQPNGRAIYFIDKDLKIPLKTIRTDFQLKSTYFSIEPKGDVVVFNGRGYGHGIGLCQEGAMRMTKLNYNYKQIIQFYYKDVNLIDLSSLNYFRLE